MSFFLISLKWMFNKITTYQKRKSKKRLNKRGDILKVNEWGALIYGFIKVFSLLHRAVKNTRCGVKHR